MTLSHPAEYPEGSQSNLSPSASEQLPVPWDAAQASADGPFSGSQRDFQGGTDVRNADSGLLEASSLQSGCSKIQSPFQTFSGIPGWRLLARNEQLFAANGSFCIEKIPGASSGRGEK